MILKDGKDGCWLFGWCGPPLGHSFPLTLALSHGGERGFLVPSQPRHPLRARFPRPRPPRFAKGTGCDVMVMRFACSARWLGFLRRRLVQRSIRR